MPISSPRVEINPAAGKTDLLLDGVVKESIYLGDHIRTRLSVAGHDDFIVKLPNKSLEADLSKGREVKLGWKAQDCRALDYQELH